MRPTRRLWGIVGLAVLLVGLAVVYARPLLLAGSALIGAWLLAHLERFRRDVQRTAASLAISQTPTQTDVRTGATVPVTLEVTCDRSSTLALEVTAGLPTAATADAPLKVSIAPDADHAARTVDVTWPVAGRHRFKTATVTATDGLLRETLPTGATPVVTVEPRGPRTIHVGEGGDRVATAYGEHQAGRQGVGLEPAEIREYVAGDTADRIDWKASARLADLHVREYEAETDRRTLLVVDHRRPLATGPPAETALDYLREVTLAMAASASRRGDPLGLLTIGDEGVTNRIDPSSAPAVYATIRRTLLELGPTGDTASATTQGAPGVPGEPATTHERFGTVSPALDRQRTTPADARHALAALETAEDAFAATLRPFYAAQRAYQARLDDTPLYGGIRRALTRAQGPVRTVLCTDDSQPAELRETVLRARRHGNTVTVLLAPRVLYEPGGLADVTEAYDRYLAFEKFRRELAGMDRVTALEVGPEDRLATVLGGGRAATSRGEHA